MRIHIVISLLREKIENYRNNLFGKINLIRFSLKGRVRRK